MQPVVIRAQQYEIVQFGFAAVFPVPDVMRMQSASGAAAGYRAGGVAVLEGTAQPAVDCAGGSAGADELPVAFEPHLAGGITGQVLAVGIGEQRSQMQRAT